MIIMLLHNHIHMMIFQNLHRKIDIPSECRSEHNNRFKSQLPSPFMNTHISHQLRSFLTVSLTCESKYESLLLQFSWHHVFDVKGQASRKCTSKFQSFICCDADCLDSLEVCLLFASARINR